MNYTDELKAASERLAPGALAPMREKALAQFLRSGFPTTRHEDWKYTDLADAEHITGAALGQTATAAGDTTPPDGVDADWLLLRNGLPDLSGLSSIEGADISLLSEAGIEPNIEHPLADLNVALLDDGVRIRIASGADIARPIGLLFDYSAPEGSLQTQGRISIEVESGASVSFIELHRSAGDGELFANNHIELKLGDNASVRYSRLQAFSRTHLQTASTVVKAGRDARLRHFSLDTGGRMVRNDLRIDIASPGSDMTFNGVYIVDKGQHVDNHTRVDHRVGPAHSSQEYRGVLKGRAVWNGKAVVHEGADGTDAQQANHNLLLADSADINAKPELEIYAEDVKCSHGTTVGQLDNDAEFYLRSRGLDPEQARRLMTQAFVFSVANTNPVEACNDLIQHQIDTALARLSGAQES